MYKYEIENLDLKERKNELQGRSLEKHKSLLCELK